MIFSIGFNSNQNKSGAVFKNTSRTPAFNLPQVPLPPTHLPRNVPRMPAIEGLIPPGQLNNPPPPLPSKEPPLPPLDHTMQTGYGRVEFYRKGDAWIP